MAKEAYHEQPMNLIMKSPLHLESNGDLLDFEEEFISLNSHSGGVENGFEEKWKKNLEAGSSAKNLSWDIGEGPMLRQNGQTQR